MLMNTQLKDEALHGIPVAYAIMRNETDPNLEFSYQEFKKTLGEKAIKYFFVDKDLQNLELLKKIFPDVLILLCTFHVIKYIHTYLANQPFSSTEKANAMMIVQNMIYCDNEDEYQHELTQLNIVANKEFTKYFIKNWDGCKEMWVQYFRNKMEIFGESINFNKYVLIKLFFLLNFYF